MFHRGVSSPVLTFDMLDMNLGFDNNYSQDDNNELLYMQDDSSHMGYPNVPPTQLMASVNVNVAQYPAEAQNFSAGFPVKMNMANPQTIMNSNMDMGPNMNMLTYQNAIPIPKPGYNVMDPNMLSQMGGRTFATSMPVGNVSTTPSNLINNTFNSNYQLMNMTDLHSFDGLNNESLLSTSVSSFIPPSTEDYSISFPSVTACTPPPPAPQNQLLSRRGSIKSENDSVLMSMGYSQQQYQAQKRAYIDASNIVPLRKYKVIRGISSGGCATRPPRQPANVNARYIPVNLDLLEASVEEMCFPQWNELERQDRRRIIRIERKQFGPRIVASFSIVGSAVQNQIPKPAPAGVEVVEVSCLECFVKPNEDEDESSDSESFSNSPLSNQSPYHPQAANNYPHTKLENYDTNGYNLAGSKQYYITSVEVIKIVELLIGTEVKDPADRRRERGRVRSNLVPFWSRKPISSRMSANSESPTNSNLPSPGYSSEDFRLELAKRIMGYDIRKPRGFDKEVRILKWGKLVPALKRALQSYYVEIPNEELA